MLQNLNFRAKNIAREAGNKSDGIDNLAKSFIQSEVIKAMENDPDQCPRCEIFGLFLLSFSQN